MKLQLEINFPHYPKKISLNQEIMMIGSCFSENIANKLERLKWKINKNPSGILFDPKAICHSLQTFLSKAYITPQHLFQNQEIWYHWHFHSLYSNINAEVLLNTINDSISKTHEQLKTCQFLILTLGSAFSYYHLPTQNFVANCHKMNAQEFEKKLISHQEIINDFENVFKMLKVFNPNLKIILTISPVRHIRDGMIENNRSKANLIQAVHHLVEKNKDDVAYFPSYEILIDILRDYRFYDIDLVHPNYLATEIVFEYFIKNLFDSKSLEYIEEINPLLQALNHRPQHPKSFQHEQFQKHTTEKITLFKKKYPFVEW